MISLMLIVGSVQAQVSYFCGMMESVIYDDCCCADADIDDGMLTESEPCCEKSVELFIDAPTDQVQTSAKLIKFESDVDPPDVIAFPAGFSLQFSTAASVIVADFTGEASGAGSTTYLITQRLRI